MRIYLTSNAVTFIWKSRGKTNGKQTHTTEESNCYVIYLAIYRYNTFSSLAQQLYRIDLTIFQNKGETRYEYWISMEHGWRRNLSLSSLPSLIKSYSHERNIKTEMNFHLVSRYPFVAFLLLKAVIQLTTVEKLVERNIDFFFFLLFPIIQW